MTLRRLASIATAFGALPILAGPAWSARVVEVRVGQHPTFTRVVFELDAPAGYRVERREVDGGQELVVKLSAASAPRQVKSSSPMVSRVELEQSGAESVARVRLRGASPRMKELILGGPPRIVLDLMLPESKLAAKPEAPKVADEALPPKVAAETPKVAEKAEPPKIAAKPEPPKVAEKPELPKVAAKPEPSKVAAKPQPPQVAEKSPPPVASPKVAVAPTPKPVDAPIEGVESALEGERIVQPKPAPTDAPEPAEVASPAPVPAPPPTAAPTPTPKATTTSLPERAKAEPKGPFGLPLSGTDPWTLGLVGAGLALFLAVVVRLLRRHSKPTSLDALELARESGESMESGDVFGTIADAGRGRTAPMGSYPVAGPGLFDDEGSKGESEMDTAAELPIERGARRALGSMGSDSDPGALQELERRMAQLESRLDEANEARERLERQVTAQSEELRVQRAAIARTQRALRGMTRVGEEQATEPALRDPTKPTAGRG